MRKSVCLVIILALGSTAYPQGIPANKPTRRPAAAPAPLNLSRYPCRIPDWLWKDQRRTANVSESVRKDIEYQVKQLEALQSLDDTTAADKLNDDIARRLGMLIPLRDLTSDGLSLTYEPQKLRLGVQIDPAFDAPSRKVLEEAARLFLTVAVDDDVIKDAWMNSSETPSPMPDMFQMEGGKPLLDSFGSKIFTQNYGNFLTSRQKPDSSESIKMCLTRVLSRPDGDRALLSISQYSGSVWWGVTYINFYGIPAYQVNSLSGPSGFLNISLNKDRMKMGEIRHNDPAFWASKIGHECLHSLGFDHPPYVDLGDRDKNNRGNQKAFIVAYELAILNRLSAKSK